MARKVSVTESIVVRRPREEVWDFTQDYARRTAWDSSILEATVLVREPAPRVRIRGAGGLRGVFHYRQFERPARTSVALEVAKSFLIEGGGGSWIYEPHRDGTLWTQTNTLVIKDGWWRALFVPIVRSRLLASTRRSLQKAKRMLETPN